MENSKSETWTIINKAMWRE